VRILLTGRNGQLGRELLRALAPLGEIDATDQRSVDLTNKDQIVGAVRSGRPDVIVNCAAYTAVDRAEAEPQLALAVNGTAVGVLAEEAKRAGALLVHFSTDYVFDGSKRSPYVETDAPNPINTYGRSKLEGERAIAESGCRYLLLRTCWLVSGQRKNFLLTVLRLAQEREDLRIVADQTGCPTSASDLADAVGRLLSLRTIPGGLYHLCNRGEATWHELAEEVLAATAARRERKVRITAIFANEYPTAAKRPRYSVLSCSMVRRDHGIELPHWRDGVRRICAALP